MRRHPLALLVVAPLACARPPAPTDRSPAEVAPPQPWEDLDGTCTREGDPEPLERTYVAAERHEVLIVPVRIEPTLAVPVAWLATGREEPDIAPFEWQWTRRERLDAGNGRVMAVAVEHVSSTVLAVEAVPHAYWVSGSVAHVRIERSASGALVAALRGTWFTDIPPWGGHWSDLGGEVRLSDDTWEPERPLAMHIELSSGNTRLCGQARLSIPAVGKRRETAIPFEVAKP